MYDGTMNATNIAFPELALTADDDVLILSYKDALEQFVYEPISQELGYDFAEIPVTYDDDLILSNVAIYDSINGREGFRLRQDITEERYWQLVEAARI